MIIFLVFDGVLHSEFCAEALHFSRLPSFESSIRDLPAVRIATSTSWRRTPVQ